MSTPVVVDPLSLQGEPMGNLIQAMFDCFEMEDPYGRATQEIIYRMMLDEAVHLIRAGSVKEISEASHAFIYSDRDMWERLDETGSSCSERTWGILSILTAAGSFSSRDGAAMVLRSANGLYARVFQAVLDLVGDGVRTDLDSLELALPDTEPRVIRFTLASLTEARLLDRSLMGPDPLWVYLGAEGLRLRSEGWRP